MRSLSGVCLVCLSGMYLGLVLAHPIRDSDVTKQNDNEAISSSSFQVARDDVMSRIRRTLPPSTRLDQLLDMYLVLVEAQGSLGEDMDQLETIDDANNFGEYNPNPKSLAIAGELSGTSSLDTIGGYSPLDADESRSKRQQGWYIQYGKRSQEPAALNIGINRAYEADDPLRDSQSLLVPSKSRSESDNFPISRFLRNLSLIAGGSGEERLFIDDENSAMIRNAKRQQGWYTQYGKRSETGLQNYLL